MYRIGELPSHPASFSSSSSSSPSSPSSFFLFLLLLFLLIHTCTDTCESAVWIPPRRHPLDSIRTALIQIFWKFIDFESRGRSGRMATSSRDQKTVDFELKSFKKSLLSRAMACQGERPRAASTRFSIKILQKTIDLESHGRLGRAATIRRDWKTINFQFNKIL